MVSLPAELAHALYTRLLTPELDRDGNTVYTVSLTLARELREVLHGYDETTVQNTLVE